MDTQSCSAFVGIVLDNGGTLYIDDGKPVAGKYEETLRNLREIAPTVYFNVPKGWEELTIALRAMLPCANVSFPA